MRIAVISDVHGNLPALQAVLDDIRADEILCAGDLVGYNPYPSEVIEVIRTNEIPCVMGNHDEAVVTGETSWFNPFASYAIFWTRRILRSDEIRFLSELPFSIKREDLAVFHGSPWSNKEYIYEWSPLEEIAESVEERITVLGHTHVPFIREIGSKIIANAGSVGQPRDGDPRACYLVISEEGMEMRRVKYNVEEVYERIIEVGLPEFLAERLLRGV